MFTEQKFDYFYGNENENFLFLQMPWVLIKDDKFKSLSMESKVLYSLFLNRTTLSAKNGWRDDEGRVYIIYTLDEIMVDLNCWREKANNSVKELKEIGLVKSIRRGLGKPNLIYVMNYATDLKYETNQPKAPKASEESGDSAEMRKSNFKSSEEKLQKFSNQTSEVRESNPNQIDQNLDPLKNIPIGNVAKNSLGELVSINRGDESEPEKFREPEKPKEEEKIEKTAKVKDDDSIDRYSSQGNIFEDDADKAPSGTANSTPPKTPPPVFNILTVQQVADKISLNVLKNKLPDNLEEIDMLFEIMCDVLTVNNPLKATYRISKQNIPAIEVRNVFSTLEQRHLEYVIRSLNNNDNKLKINKNITSYLMTSLFHAPRTITHLFDRIFSKPDSFKQDKPYSMSSTEFFETLVQKSMKFGRFAEQPE